MKVKYWRICVILIWILFKIWSSTSLKWENNYSMLNILLKNHSKISKLRFLLSLTFLPKTSNFSANRKWSKYLSYHVGQRHSPWLSLRHSAHSYGNKSWKIVEEEYINKGIVENVGWRKLPSSSEIWSSKCRKHLLHEFSDSTSQKHPWVE